VGGYSLYTLQIALGCGAAIGLAVWMLVDQDCKKEN